LLDANELVCRCPFTLVVCNEDLTINADADPIRSAKSVVDPFVGSVFADSNGSSAIKLLAFARHQSHSERERRIEIAILIDQAKGEFMKIRCDTPAVTNTFIRVNYFIVIEIPKA